MSSEEIGELSLASITGGQKQSSKSHELLTCTIRNPGQAYAHLELVTDGQPRRDSGGGGEAIDVLQVRSHLTSALRQFLGISGTGMPIDILKVEGRECWVRLPEQDLSAFAAAIASWPGAPLSGDSTATTMAFRLMAAGNWLGNLVGQTNQQKIWAS